MDYLNELNESQRAAVLHTEGPSMVIAGAGSGKTRVLTYKIAHLIEKGVDPFNILALTFTNKAAREMKERIGQIIGEAEARNIWMGTFHSVFARILRFEAEKLGYPSNFTIYDTADSKSLLKSIIKDMQLDDKIYKPGLVLGRISAAKNNLISPQAYKENSDVAGEDHLSGRPKLADIYHAYAVRCYRAGAMDFDDLLYNTNVLLRDYPDVLHKYQHKYHHILVDEYQDTNYSQYLIVKKLAALNENLCVVGDDAQSIYAFRGADIYNILNFKKDYPDYKLFKLEQNYRSTQTIVNAANSIIDKNKNQIKKKVWTDNEEGSTIEVKCCVSDSEEGFMVSNAIFDTQMSEQALYSDFAILYRTNAQSRSMEEALRKLNIPYRIYGGLSFYQRKEIKDLLAYFRLTANPNDEEALKRIINYPARGIGATTVDRIVAAALENNVALWDVVTEPQQFGVSLRSNIVQQIQGFVSMIRGFRNQLAAASAYDLGHLIASSSGLLRDLHADKTPEGVSRYENIQELLNGLKNFTEQAIADGRESHTLSDFLIDVALLTDADQDDDDNNKVTLMTIHAAKGLEFPYIYIVGMEENLFPSQMALESRSGLEEERRLFYVALTRAEKRAMLSYALSRYKWGNLQRCEPSRFIDDIDEKYLTLPPKPHSTFAHSETRSAFGTKYRPRTAPETAQPKPFEPRKNLKKVQSNMASAPGDNALGLSLAVGDEVEHDRFGKGKVLQLEGKSPDTKATVFFPTVGQKQLLLRFARLRLLN
ncbi:MAG: ATP-dependent DNA helicase [Cryomorphaceae bacterium]|nr:MAG: ATP-dependent DNA helicase [Cryomorphaceae bacterium]